MTGHASGRLAGATDHELSALLQMPTWIGARARTSPPTNNATHRMELLCGSNACLHVAAPHNLEAQHNDPPHRIPVGLLQIFEALVV